MKINKTFITSMLALTVVGSSVLSTGVSDAFAGKLVAKPSSLTAYKTATSQVATPVLSSTSATPQATNAEVFPTRKFMADIELVPDPSTIVREKLQRVKVLAARNGVIKTDSNGYPKVYYTWTLRLSTNTEGITQTFPGGRKVTTRVRTLTGSLPDFNPATDQILMTFDNYVSDTKSIRFNRIVLDNDMMNNLSVSASSSKYDAPSTSTSMIGTVNKSLIDCSNLKPTVYSERVTDQFGRERVPTLRTNGTLTFGLSGKNACIK